MTAADPWQWLHDNDFSWDDVNAMAAILEAGGFDITETEPAPRGTVLAELDACRPLMNGTGPAQGGRTFSGWEVPDWLMLRVRSALRSSIPDDGPTSPAPLRGAELGPSSGVEGRSNR